MKVILLQDDKKLGKKNTVIEVADSYARNVLIPKKVVLQATEANLKILNMHLAQEKRDYENALQGAADLSKTIAELHEITIPVVCSKTGKMFGSVTAKDISEALFNHDIPVSKSEISIANPIRELGQHMVIIKLFGGITTKLYINVVGG